MRTYIIETSKDTRLRVSVEASRVLVNSATRTYDFYRQIGDAIPSYITASFKIDGVIGFWEVKDNE